ncbi:MAG: hypothetical protein WDZ62_01450 [Candidatus Pacearchaeota archaeon]
MLEPSLRDSALQEYLDASNLFYQDLLGYKPEETSLEKVHELQWERFAIQKGLNPHSSGIYLPRNQTAVIRGENLLTLFHEYFGHGLYCEQNLTGRKLVDLEKKLLEEEKREFQNRKFTLKDLNAFRKDSSTSQKLGEFREKNLGSYELFASWTEYLVSKKFGLENEFEERYNNFVEKDKKVFDSIINLSENYGDLATFYAQGLARKTNPKRTKSLLKDMIKNLDSVKLGVLFGSKKPFSDIDVYLVSDKIEPSKSDWIDVRVHDSKRFEEGIKNFDLRVMDPLFSGELIFGEEDYFKEQKQKLQEQPITEESIKYNLKKSRDYGNQPPEYFESFDRVNDPSSYTKTYLANALALKEGLKLFTKKDLISYSRSEKFIELKGGIK